MLFATLTTHGGTLTHSDSDVCINIEPGTFLDGNRQSIFFHVIYNVTYVIRDIPETNERTLISPMIKCGSRDINPQKELEIIVPHCLLDLDEVKKGFIAVYSDLVLLYYVLIFFSWRSPCIVFGKLNPVQACGPDAIPNWLLKECA